MREIPGITALRALAAGLVLVSHVAFWSGASGLDGVGPLLARGDAGVAVFFAISAFLLLRPAFDPARPWPPRRYAAKRFARIVPAYWCALLGVLLVAPLTEAGIGDPLKILHHVMLLQGFTQDPYQGFTQTWSLTTEVSFYVLVPLVGRALRRGREQGRPLVGALLMIGALGVLLQAWSASHRQPAFGALSTSVFGHVAWFVAGAVVLCAQMPGAVESSGRLRRCGSWTPLGALGMAVSLYVLAATPLGGPVGLSAPGALSAGAKELLYAVIAGCLVHAVTGTLPTRISTFVNTPAVRTAGEVSYGVFLWHVLVIQVLFLGVGLRLFHAPFLLVLVPTVVFSLALAWCSWTFVEQPAIAWAHRRKPARTS